MKKIVTLILACLMIFTLASCNSKNENGGNGSGNSNEKYEEQLEMFSVEAAEYYLEKATSIKLSDIEPKWEWEFTSKYSALGEDGRAKVTFTKKDAELTDEEIDAYFKELFDKTASVSQDGHNIIGYEFVGDGEEATDEVTLEEALGGWIQGWGFRYNDKFMVVYVSTEYDNDKDSELDRIFYYNGISVEIAEGMQKGWDDYMSDIEENEDAIKEAIEDFTS